MNARVEERLRDIEFRGSSMERTLAGAVRELAGDMLRISRGERPFFAERFADRYDLALIADDTDDAARYGSAGDDRHDFQVDSPPRRSRRADDVTSLGYDERSVAADDVSDT